MNKKSAIKFKTNNTFKAAKYKDVLKALSETMKKHRTMMKKLSD